MRGTSERARRAQRESDDRIDRQESYRGDRAGGDGCQPGPQHRPARYADGRAQPHDGEDDGVHQGVRRRGPVHGLRVRRGLRERAGDAASDHRDGQGGQARRRRDRGAHPASRRGRHHHRRGQLTLPGHRAPHRGVRRERDPVHGRRRAGGGGGRAARPSIMPGGDPAAYAEVEEIFTSIAAVVDDTPCCVHVGPGGAGHYVKMVHNGIEYADIQLIAEAYDLLTHVAGLDAPAIAKIFEEWTSGALDSFLIEITAKVLGKTDEKSGGPLVDVILDEAQQKGTGTWTAVDALGLGIPLTGITEAVFARGLSTLRAERKAASTTLAGPNPAASEDRQDLVDDIRQALY